MSADVPIVVKVEVTKEESVVIFAVTLGEAEEIARNTPGVLKVIESHYQENDTAEE